MEDAKIPGGQPRELGASCDREGMGGPPSLDKVYVNPVTGNRFTLLAPRWTVHPNEVKARFHVYGLKVFKYEGWYEFVYRDICPIDEPTARDAQCRAGWDDVGYGFYDFKACNQEDGTYLAVWKCQVCCD